MVVKLVKLSLRSNIPTVKLTILRVIYEMANHGFLNGPHGFSMVEYVIQQCAASKKSMLHQTQLNLPPAPQDQEILEMSVNLLEHLTTSVLSMTDVLWPRLLSVVVLPDYTTILTPLCGCLTHLALRKQQEGLDAAQLDYRGKG
ncbi:maestro heat-like repeat-containing protein family member 1 [Ambystoma mexicanum]|uniref:maestro heat-like repeat-containing protein family member 1 n=1 Tax=Ambystoma mexicanum TaxID=8296 RepID=UPI0037E98D1C